MWSLKITSSRLTPFSVIGAYSRFYERVFFKAQLDVPSCMKTKVLSYLHHHHLTASIQPDINPAPLLIQQPSRFLCTDSATAWQSTSEHPGVLEILQHAVYLQETGKSVVLSWMPGHTWVPGSNTRQGVCLWPWCLSLSRWYVVMASWWTQKMGNKPESCETVRQGAAFLP
jgi:hypothetical protein